MQLSSFARVALVTLFAATLSACGGGGSGGSGSMPQAAVEVPSSSASSSSSVNLSSAAASSIALVTSGADDDFSAASASSLQLSTFSNSIVPLANPASLASSSPVASAASLASSAKAIASSSVVLSSIALSSRAAVVSSVATVSASHVAASSVPASVKNSSSSSVKGASTSSVSSSSAALMASSSALSSIAVSSAKISSSSIAVSSAQVSSSSAGVIFARPSVQIIFPTSVVTSDAKSVLVRGTAASKLGKVISVHVNGFFATSADDFANWQVRVPLSAGENRLKVSVTDSAGNMALEAAEVTVVTPVVLRDPKAFVLDAVRNRMLVVDAGHNAIIEIDLASGVCRMFADMHDFDNGKGLVNATAIALDEARGYALVVDQGRDAVIAVDLVTGSHGIFSGPGAIHFSAVKSMVVDRLNGRALVLDSGSSAVIAVDLFSGVRTRFAQVPESSQGLALDAANNRALVLGNVPEVVIAVNLENGSSHEIASNASSGEDISLRQSQEIVVDADRGRALVAGSFNFRGEITSVDLATGERRLMSAHDVPGSVGFTEALDFVMDKTHDRALLLDQAKKTVIAVDLNTGMRSILFTQGESELMRPFLTDPNAVAFDMPRNRALVLDKFLGGLVAVDLTSGERSLFARSAAPEVAGRVVDSVGGIVIDAARNRALVVDGDSNAVVAIDLSTGARSLLSNGVTDAGEVVFNPFSISLDLERNRALVLDFVAGGNGSLGGAVVAVDLTNGSRTILSRNDAPSETVSERNFSWAHAITLDPARNRALVTDNGTSSVLAVDLLSGARTLLYSWHARGDSSLILANPYGITLDPVRNRALVADKGLPALMAVDLTDGLLSVVSRNINSTSANFFSYPIYTAVDPVYERALVVDGDLRAIVEVDLITGERVLLAR